METVTAVKVNAGAAEVDKEAMADFRKDLKGNLSKAWNRMFAGSCPRLFYILLRGIEVRTHHPGVRPWIAQGERFWSAHGKSKFGLFCDDLR